MRPAFLLCTLPALLLTGGVPSAHAQAPTAIPAPVAVGRALPPGQPPEDRGPQLDFSFHNLPLVEVIQQIQKEYQKASGKHLNIMIPENLRDVATTNRIDVELKQISVPEVLELLGMASQREVTTSIAYPGAPYPGKIMMGYSFRRVSANEGTLTYLLTGNFPSNPTPPSERPQPPAVALAEPPIQPRTVFFFSLDPYLDRFTVDDIITAVKTGWELDGKTERPTLKYHEETKLLVASGDPSQVEMIKMVLMNLQRGSRAGASPTPPKP